MPPTPDSLPDDVATLKAMVIATQVARLEAEAKARNAEAELRARELLIEQMKDTIAKLKHERFGQSSERSAVLEQLELRLADLEEDASQAEAAAQMAASAAAGAKVTVQAFERRKPAGECQVFCVRGLREGGSLVWSGFSRTSPSNARWPTRAEQQALSRPSAAEGGGRRPGFTGLGGRPYWCHRG